MIRYLLVKWEFNRGAWSQAMHEAEDLVGIDVLCGIMEVKPVTVRNWQSMNNSAYEKYPHPSMHNFLKFCFDFDKDPRDFFLLEGA